MQRLRDYEDLWLAIKQVAPSALLLRAPEGMNSYYNSQGGDLDILIDRDSLSAVVGCLKSKGFAEEYSPQSFRRTLMLREVSQTEPYTVDLYLEQHWGLGFRASGNCLPQEPMADFLRAIFDGKGKRYFESKHSEGLGALWSSAAHSYDRVIVERLWKYSFLRLLSLYMVVTGKVKADWPVIIKTLQLLFSHQIKRIIYKRGIEAALIGIDGSGKSSMTQKLQQLPLPMSTVYMGSSQFKTFIMRSIDQNKGLRKLHFFGYHFEMMARRWRGWMLSRRGWVVIYDRHPIETLRLDKGFKKWLNNGLTSLYSWRLDRTFWLTGDIQQIQKRKAEHSLQELKEMDRDLERKLLKLSAPFIRLDSTGYDLEQLYRIVGADLITLYQSRTENERL